MGRKALAFLALVRAFLTPSAPADSLAGLAIASVALGRVAPPGSVIAVVVASIALYWFGMATGDLFDRRRDRERAPWRPIPSGRIRPGEAIAASAILGSVGLAAAAAAGSGTIALALLLLILVYGAGGKRLPLVGGLLMGGCRGANLLLGAAAVLEIGELARASGVLLAAGLLTTHVAFLTALGYLEDFRHRPALFHLHATPLLIVPLALGILRPDSAPVWGHSILLTAVLVRSQRRAARLPVSGDPTTRPHPATLHVRGALGVLILLDAALVWTFSPPGDEPSITLAALYGLALLGWWWKRRWLQSGGSDT